MAAFVILMDANGCFTKKHSIVPTFKNVGVSFARKSVKKSEISRYLFASHEVNIPYLT